jgi:hypothetical protein
MMCDFPDPPAALKQDACTARIVDKANAAGSASGAIGAGASLVLLGSLCELLWLEPRWKGHSFPSARFYDNRLIMKKSINDNQKSRGRPATGTAPLVGVRMTEELQSQIRAWANKQADNLSLAAAIRRLVELGLKAKK